MCMVFPLYWCCRSYWWYVFSRYRIVCSHLKYSRFASDSSLKNRKKTSKTRRQTIKIEQKKNCDQNAPHTMDGLTAVLVNVNDCICMSVWHLLVRQTKSHDTKNCETNVEQQITGGCRVNENKWYKNLHTHCVERRNVIRQKPSTFKRLKISPQTECVRWTTMHTYIVSRQQNSNTFLNWIFFGPDFLCLVCISSLSPYMYSIHHSIFISLSFAGQMFFFSFLFSYLCLGSKHFYGRLLVVIFRSHRRVVVVFLWVSNSQIFLLYSHMVKTPPTNAHCYKNAGHHSYRMKEWGLQQLKVNIAQTKQPVDNNKK